MSGQKYKRTNFDDDDNTSMGGTPPGVTYDPAIAFKVGASFWQKRSGLEKVLVVFSLLLVLAVVILSSLLATKQNVEQLKVIQKVGQKDKDVLCTTPACVTVASSIITSMDVDVDPCKDFYEYACGGWIKSHPIPSGQSRWGTFGVMWKENQLVMKNVLEQPLNQSHSEAEQKAKLYYYSCLDKNKTIEALGAQPIYDLVMKFGGWNISARSGMFSEAKWDFQTQLERIHGYGLSVFFDLWVGEDEKSNPKKNIMQFDQEGLGLARDQYLNKTIKDDKVLSAYLKYMVDIGYLLGGDRNETEEQMIRVIEFEQALANITTPEEDRRDGLELYNKMTLKQLQKKAPFINWVDYVNKLLKVVPYRVKSGESVVVFAVDYLEQLSTLVTEMLSTPDGKNTLNNYMIWHLVKLMASYLSKPFRDAKKEFTEVISGVTGHDEQWRYCTTDTDQIVGFALGAMFVREAFHGGKNDKVKAEKMIQQIKQAFQNNLPQLMWMDKETREAAMEKAKAVIDMIGFPEFILNATALDQRYAGLAIKSDEYFQNNVRDLLFNMKRNLNKLRKPPDSKSWSMTPPQVNAYYSPTKNEIVFPAGILQAPFYSSDYPKSLNFGAMGVVMGHELTHGFDDQGREYDKVGVLRPWWNKESISRFKERTKCMIDQYSKYKVNGDNVRGKQTLGENIADNGGLKSAYHAYSDWVKDHGEEQQLPGTNLTHKQLFFVAFAQVWCTNSRPQADHLTILTDPHAPARFRVVGPLSNSVEFATNFECKPGTPMNPKSKCEVW